MFLYQMIPDQEKIFKNKINVKSLSFKFVSAGATSVRKKFGTLSSEKSSEIIQKCT